MGVEEKTNKVQVADLSDGITAVTQDELQHTLSEPINDSVTKKLCKSVEKIGAGKDYVFSCRMHCLLKL